MNQLFLQKIPQMKNIFFIAIIISFFAHSMRAQDEEPGDLFTVVFYNVENLFDTIDHPAFEDEEFTPESEKDWNTERYNKKLTDISRVLSETGKGELPEIIGLAEVENKKVLEDLVNTSSLLSGNYGIVHEEGIDRRGIDVALLYRKDEFRNVKFETIRIDFPFDSSLTTRDILYVSGRASDGNDLHVFVNHWSSRYGGMRESEPKRMYCAVALRRKIDFLLSVVSDPRIIIMGDFNDEPTNKSLMYILQAANKKKNIGHGDLYNLFYNRHNENSYGSYNYRGTWNMLDQIIVSYSMINRPEAYSCDYDDGRVFSREWMIYETDEGLKVPDKTYGGPNYYGGISDHFPVLLRLTK